MKTLALLLICINPYPQECITPHIDEITRNPMCVAASQGCTLHQKIVDGGRDECVAWAKNLLMTERKLGYRRSSMPECFTK